MHGVYATFLELAFEWVYIVAGLCLTLSEIDHGIVGINCAGYCVYDGALSYDCAGIARPPPEET